MDIIEWNRSWWKRKGQKVLLQESPILLLTSAGDTSFSMATLASTLLYRAILFQQSGYQSFRRVAVAAESPSTPGTLNTKIEWKWGGGQERPYVAPWLISQALFRETFLQLILLLSKVILAWKIWVFFFCIYFSICNSSRSGLGEKEANGRIKSW